MYLQYMQFKDKMDRLPGFSQPKFNLVVVGALDSKRKTNTGMCTSLFTYFIVIIITVKQILSMGKFFAAGCQLLILQPTIYDDIKCIPPKDVDISSGW